ncbi:hypothetical protein [Pseudanabaena sp. PCC 6802]|uniref:hypothetical protein n=1 Tax=Pseudanabaena sp. PCC 6802 TaxID=118173 RepID=UPI00034D79D9|nr:hypothetical protein [Pseudanabaena sp. PCC 6802]
MAQQKQILDFAEFIYSQTKPKETLQSDSEPISALELAGDLIGALEVGGDLSLQKHELKKGSVLDLLLLTLSYCCTLWQMTTGWSTSIVNRFVTPPCNSYRFCQDFPL